MLLLSTNKRRTLIMLDIMLIMLDIMFNSDTRKKAASMLGLYKLPVLFCYRILLRAVVVVVFSFFHYYIYIYFFMHENL